MKIQYSKTSQIFSCFHTHKLLLKCLPFIPIGKYHPHPIRRGCKALHSVASYPVVSDVDERCTWLGCLQVLPSSVNIQKLCAFSLISDSCVVVVWIMERVVVLGCSLHLYAFSMQMYCKPPKLRISVVQSKHV